MRLVADRWGTAKRKRMIYPGNEIVDCEDKRNNSDYNCAVEKRRFAHKALIPSVLIIIFFSSLSGHAYYSRVVKLFKLFTYEVASAEVSQKKRIASMN